MEEKELNLAELLKGCEGEEFYSNAYGEVTFIDFIEHSIHGTLIHISWSLYEKDDYECNLDTNGCENPNGRCILFPSKALYEKYPLDAYSAWMEWKEIRRPKYNVKVIIECWQDNDDNPQTKTFGATYSSEEEAQQAAESVRETLMKFHEKNSAQNLDN